MKESPTTSKRLLTVREAATFLNISEQYIRNRMSKNAEHPFPIKAKRIGSAVRFDIKDLEAYIESI